MPHIFTCGSVDDGKSTILGRFLFDTGCLPNDLLAKVTKESHQRAFDGCDYSLAFNGLIDEKAQGITIDVAWRYVTLDGMPLVLADCPGHTQYTRNMVSAASQCAAGILLVDASRGITAQTRRHLYVCALMRMRHIFVAINKLAAGMVLDPAPRQVFWQNATVGRAERMQRLRQKPLALWLTGLSGAGKTTLANAVESALHAKGFATYLLDGDNIRHGLCRDLGFSHTDRAENIRRVGEVAHLMVDAGLIVLASFISPSQSERDSVRQRFAPGDFAEV